MTTPEDANTVAGGPPVERGVRPLVACPLCGADSGYLLTEGSSYRWWLAQCKHCGDTVAECASDRRTAAGTVLPDRWPAADEAWNAAGAHAHMLRGALRQVAQAHAWLAFGECRSFGADVPLLTPSDADALARVALGEYREGPNVELSGRTRSAWTQG